MAKRKRDQIDGSGSTSFADVARKIGDPELVGVLEEGASFVRDEVHNSKFDLKRARARRDLERLKSEGRRFKAALSQAWDHMLDFPPNAGDIWSAARKAIAEIEALSDNAIDRLDRKGGRPALPGRVNCAWMVITAWAAIHGKRPSANNAKAQEACDDYWVACGGKREGDASKWHRHIKAARDVPEPQGTK